MIIKLLGSLAFALPLAMFAQSTTDYFQVNYASNLGLGDGVVNITNTGSSAGGTTPTVGSGVGAICVNIYGYVPDEQQAVCCTCYASPNSLHSLPIVYGPTALFANPLTSAEKNPNSVVIKLLAQKPTGFGTCANAADATAANLTTGLRAWGTHSHPTNTASVAITETPFSSSDLSVGELGFLTSGCNAIRQSGSGAGVCAGCQLGGLSTGLSTTL